MGAYSPFDNALLEFQVQDGALSVDVNTGNRIPTLKSELYICNIQLELSSQENRPGADKASMRASGRLLNPTTFSEYIKVGSIARCRVNGIEGRLIITDLGTNLLPFVRNDLFSQFTGRFEQFGNAG